MHPQDKYSVLFWKPLSWGKRNLCRMHRPFFFVRSCSTCAIRLRLDLFWAFARVQFCSKTESVGVEFFGIIMEDKPRSDNDGNKSNENRHCSTWFPIYIFTNCGFFCWISMRYIYMNNLCVTWIELGRRTNGYKKKKRILRNLQVKQNSQLDTATL